MENQGNQQKEEDQDLVVLDKRLNRYEAYVGLKEVQKHWGWFLGIGILLIILGILAIGGATVVTLASMLFFGALLLAGGIVQGVNAIKTRSGGSFFINLLTAVLYIVVGIMLLLNPAVGAITLTLLLAAFYTVEGIFKIVTAITHRFAHWGWLLFSGIVSLILGLLIWSQWPVAGLWVIGLFIGIDMIIIGWVWVALALSAKTLDTKRTP